MLLCNTRDRWTHSENEASLEVLSSMQWRSQGGGERKGWNFTSLSDSGREVNFRPIFAPIFDPNHQLLQSFTVNIKWKWRLYMLWRVHGWFAMANFRPQGAYLRLKRAHPRPGSFESKWGGGHQVLFMGGGLLDQTLPWLISHPSPELWLRRCLQGQRSNITD